MLHQDNSRPLIGFFPRPLCLNFKILLLKTVLKSLVRLPEGWGRDL